MSVFLSSALLPYTMVEAYLIRKQRPTSDAFWINPSNTRLLKRSSRGRADHHPWHLWTCVASSLSCVPLRGGLSNMATARLLAEVTRASCENKCVTVADVLQSERDGWSVRLVDS